MRARRRRMERRPQRQRRLSKPVISVGNLSMGGTGKTPVVAAIAEWLIGAGYRPSILTRGYGREDALDGVVVINPQISRMSRSDQPPSLRQTGDEPLMLARRVLGATVCVSPDRYLGGVLAEKLGCDVHVLDDGFQHIELARQLDILVTTVGEIPNGRVIPLGRLREPMDAAARAHFLVVTDATAGAASAEAWTLGISQSCGSRRMLGAAGRDQGSGIGDQGSGGSCGRWYRPSGTIRSIAPRRRMECRRLDDVRRSSSLFAERPRCHCIEDGTRLARARCSRPTRTRFASNRRLHRSRCIACRSKSSSIPRKHCSNR